MPYFEFRLCAAYWAHFMCHNESWPTLVICPFSFINMEENIIRKYCLPIFGFVFQTFEFPDFFPCIQSNSCHLSFSIFWLGCYSSMWRFFGPRKSSANRHIVNWSRVVISSANQLNGCPHFFRIFLYPISPLNCDLSIVCYLWEGR